MKLLSGFAFLLIVGASQLPAVSLSFLDFTFDEGGDASYQVTSTAGGLQNGYTSASGTANSTELSAFGDGAALVYDLPYDVANGVVFIDNKAGNTLLDILVFTNQADITNDATPPTTGTTANLMLFYATDATSVGTSAGVSTLPSNLTSLTPIQTIDENAQGTFEWLPASDGAFAYPNGNQYNELAGAPEPASLALFGSGLAGLLFLARKRRSLNK